MACSLIAGSENIFEASTNVVKVGRGAGAAAASSPGSLTD